MLHDGLIINILFINLIIINNLHMYLSYSKTNLCASSNI